MLKNAFTFCHNELPWGGWLDAFHSVLGTKLWTLTLFLCYVSLKHETHILRFVCQVQDRKLLQ